MELLSQRLTAISRKQFALLAACLLAALAAALYINQTPAPIELESNNHLDLAELKQRWAQGEMIVLVRHLERCDHSTEPCLVGNSGITARAVPIAAAIGEEFRQIGLDHTDIFNSPTERTVQSAQFIFGNASSTQDWLATCKKNMDKDVLAHKQPGRNLIMVTHSECIAEFEHAMHLKPITLDYGSSLFVSADDAGKPVQVLGYIDSDDWAEAMGR